MYKELVIDQNFVPQRLKCTKMQHGKIEIFWAGSPLPTFTPSTPSMFRPTRNEILAMFLLEESNHPVSLIVACVTLHLLPFSSC